MGSEGATQSEVGDLVQAIDFGLGRAFQRHGSRGLVVACRMKGRHALSGVFLVMNREARRWGKARFCAIRPDASKAPFVRYATSTGASVQIPWIWSLSTERNT